MQPLFSGFLARRVQRARIVNFLHLVVGEAEHLTQNLVGMLAEQRRALYLARAVGQLDGVADRQIFAARGVIHLDNGAGRAQRLIFGEFLHRQDRTAGDVELIEDLHGLELGLGHGPLLNAREDFIQARQPGRGFGVVGMGLPAGLANHVADLLPNRRLGDEVDVGVGIGFPALALENAARLTTAGIVAGAWHGITERYSFAELAVFLERAVSQTLLVA